MRRKKSTALLLSATAILVLTAAGSLSASIQYKITKGDSLWTIARKHDTHVRDIAKANHLRGDETLKLGRVLTIPTPAPRKRCDQKLSTRNSKNTKSASKLPVKIAKSAKKPASASVSYKIRQGDSLWTIAKRHSVSVRCIAQANGMRGNETLKLGRKLVIPVRVSREPRAKHHQGSHEKVAKKDKTTPVRVASADTGQSASGRSQVVRKALAYRGSRYRRGGTSAAGFDCSGFTRHIYRKYGVSLPHSSRAQAHAGKSVPRNQLRQGDLVFFSTYRRGISHVGIYIGSGKFVHASTYGRGVRTDNLNSAYYRSRYRGARRV